MEQLLAKAKAGDKQAEKQIFDHLFVRFKSLAVRNIGTEDCDDLVQETCMTILEKYKDTTFKVSFTAWAYGVLKVKMIKYLQLKQRDLERQSSLNEEVDSPQDSTDDPVLIRMLIDCIKKISKVYMRYARALNLNYQGYKTEEICERLDIKPNHFYVTLNRGRALLKECLETGGVSW